MLEDSYESDRTSVDDAWDNVLTTAPDLWLFKTYNIQAHTILYQLKWILDLDMPVDIGQIKEKAEEY